MNTDGLTPGIVKTFERVTAFYRLTEDEKEFVLRVFVRFTALVVETREKMTNTFGYFPQTEDEQATMAIGFSIFYDRPLGEELLIGLENHPRQELVLEAIRAIAVLAFPRKVVVHMLDAFS